MEREDVQRPAGGTGYSGATLMDWNMLSVGGVLTRKVHRLELEGTPTDWVREGVKAPLARVPPTFPLVFRGEHIQQVRLSVSVRSAQPLTAPCQNVKMSRFHHSIARTEQNRISCCSHYPTAAVERTSTTLDSWRFDTRTYLEKVIVYYKSVNFKCTEAMTQTSTA